jgi:hypothetical protein
MVLGNTAGIAEAVADGQTGQGTQGLCTGQGRIVDQIVSGKHFTLFPPKLLVDNY